MYDTAKVLSISDKEYPKMALLTWLTMFNGFLSSYVVTSSRWIFFVLSSAAFAGLLYMVLHGEDNPEFGSLKPLVLVGWTLFPVVFLLAPTGVGVLGTATAEAGYLLLDIATKIAFGVMTSKLK
jgi:sensory rhodopsin